MLNVIAGIFRIVYEFYPSAIELVKDLFTESNKV
jgi:hypothetical protein